MDKQEKLYLDSQKNYLESLEISLLTLENEEQYHLKVLELADKSLVVNKQRQSFVKNLIEETKNIINDNI